MTDFGLTPISLGPGRRASAGLHPPPVERRRSKSAGSQSSRNSTQQDTGVSEAGFIHLLCTHPHLRLTSRGRPPAHKRWSISAYQNAFVIEPNLESYPLEKALVDNFEQGGESMLHAAMGLPQLIIFRESDAIVQVANSVHGLAAQYGPLEQTFKADALFGIISIGDYRFLVLAVESSCVAALPSTFPRHRSGSNDAPSEEEEREWHRQPERCIYRIVRALLVPFHVALDKFTSAVLQIPSAELLERLQRMKTDEGGECSTPSRRSRKSREGANVVDATLSGLLGDKIAAAKLCLEKMLSQDFYYSFDLDITHSLQRKYLMQGAEAEDSCRPQIIPSDWHYFVTGQPVERRHSFLDTADPRFMWNRRISEPILQWCADSRWLTPLVQGSVCSTVLSNGPTAVELILICRRSSRRGGTRYNHRGIDERGSVANFCETELLVCTSRVEPMTGRPTHWLSPKQRHAIGSTNLPGTGWASHVQVRGSVPLFWEQSGTMINPPPHLLKRKENTLKAFSNHQLELHENYGDIFYFNLLSSTKGGEHKLTKALIEMFDFYRRMRHGRVPSVASEDFGPPGSPRRRNATGPQTMDLITSGSSVSHSHWDFHHEVKSKGFEAALSEFILSPVVQNAYYKSGAFVENPLWSNGASVQFQNGVVRTNCLDCLDRTNAFQYAFSWAWLSQYLSERGMRSLFQSPAIKSSSLKINITHSILKSLVGSADDLNESAVSFNNKQDLYVTYFGGLDGGVSVQSYRLISEPRRPPGGASHLSDEESLIFPNVLKDLTALMWADHGDHVSLAYTGTGSVISSLIKSGKSTFTTNVDHVWRSLGRLYQNTFEDNFRQDCLNLLVSRRSAGVPRMPVIHNAKRQQQRTELKPSSDNEPSMMDASLIDTNPVEFQAMDETTSSDSTPATPQFFTVWLGSWNLNGRAVYENLEKWLLLGSKEKADIFVVCLQELFELSSIRVLLSQNDAEKEWQLDYAVLQVLGAEYEKIAGHSLVGLYTAVFAKKSVSEFVSNIVVDDVKLGFRGQMGNKGAVLIRFFVGTSSLLFVNAHLLPGVNKFDERIQQLVTIMDSTLYNVPFSTSDLTCVTGDLNFRLASDVAPEDAENLLRSGHAEELFRQDQFVLCRKMGIVPLQEFREAHELLNPRRPSGLLLPPFPPTYKYKKGYMSTVDSTRTVAWCDRVLLQGALLDRVECLRYVSIPFYMTSDHKPIAALLRIDKPFDDFSAEDEHDEAEETAVGCLLD